MDSFNGDYVCMAIVIIVVVGMLLDAVTDIASSYFKYRYGRKKRRKKLFPKLSLFKIKFK
jgi:hypothetical protein